MTRTNLLAQLLRALRVAHYAEQHNVGTAEAQERLAELAYREALLRRDRRDFLKTAAGAAVITAGALLFRNSHGQDGSRASPSSAAPCRSVVRISSAQARLSRRHFWPDWAGWFFSENGVYASYT